MMKTTLSTLFFYIVCSLVTLLPQAVSTQQITKTAEPAGPIATETPNSDQPPTPSEPQRVVKIPILVYHRISQAAPTGSRGMRRLSVSAETFDQQMKFLQDNGYHVITFAALADYFAEGGELPTQPVIISFDDGWQNQFTYALPSLEKYHYNATFFIVTDVVGRRGFLSWPELRTMVDEGMTIGSHSRSHPNLKKITDTSVLWDQIYNSKQILETRLDIKVEEFAYPYGFYDSTTAAMVQQAGYKAARACCYGGAKSQKDIYTLRALMVPNDLTKFENYLASR